MPADFILIVGTHKTIVPRGLKGGLPAPFPLGTTFLYTTSDPLIQFTDPTAASPEIFATDATTSDATITMTVMEKGFTHTKSHTVSAQAAQVDELDDVDFDIV